MLRDEVTLCVRSREIELAGNIRAARPPLLDTRPSATTRWSWVFRDWTSRYGAHSGASVPANGLGAEFPRQSGRRPDFPIRRYRLNKFAIGAHQQASDARVPLRDPLSSYESWMMKTADQDLSMFDGTAEGRNDFYVRCSTIQDHQHRTLWPRAMGSRAAC